MYVLYNLTHFEGFCLENMLIQPKSSAQQMCKNGFVVIRFLDFCMLVVTKLVNGDFQLK